MAARRFSFLLSRAKNISRIKGKNCRKKGRKRTLITKDVKECYESLGIIHNSWNPIPKEFDDYIANPKPNLYQSLHTVVVGPEKQLFEFQIRTEEMDKIAEEGI